MRANPDFRLFSPDQLDSNKVFEAATQRNFQRPLEGGDQVEHIGHEGVLILKEGNTTNPFDMLVRNGANLYHLVAQALRAAASGNDEVAASISERVRHYECLVRAFHDEIRETGKDPDEITGWKREL